MRARAWLFSWWAGARVHNHYSRIARCHLWRQSPSLRVQGVKATWGLRVLCLCHHLIGSGQCAGYDLAPDGVRLQMRPERGGGGGMQGTGLAYVTFASAEEAERARQERDRQTIGSRYIECLPYTPQPPVYGPQGGGPPGGGGYSEGPGSSPGPGGGGRGAPPSGDIMPGGGPGVGGGHPTGGPGGSPSGGGPTGGGPMGGAPMGGAPMGGPGGGPHMGALHMGGPPGGGGHMGGGPMGGHGGGSAGFGGGGERGFGGGGRDGAQSY